MHSRHILHLLLLAAVAAAGAQSPKPLDSDHDDLSDTLENALLQRFAPTFMIDSNDCSAQPARFVPGLQNPTVAAEDGTIYGQAMPRTPSQIELHYYHLWRTDCGRMGHPLDAEHVAVLLNLDPPASQDDPAAWHATHWYAAAHEDTVCDASHLTRAATLNAEDHGPRIWISAGKHASFLTEEMCHHGCGGDRCTHSKPLNAPAIINLGELDAPMHGAVWQSSSRWPLKDKLGRSDFTTTRLNRLQHLPTTDIAWANPAKRPAQAAILGGNTAVNGARTGANGTISGATTGATTTGAALTTTARSTDTALSVTATKTTDALGKATHNTTHAVAGSASAIKHALTRKKPAPAQTPE